jgi:hypothetical protein
MGEFLSSKNSKGKAENHLEKEEEKWMGKINIPTIHSPNSPQKSCW